MKFLLLIQKVTDKLYIIFSRTIYFFLNIFFKNSQQLIPKERINFFKENDYVIIEDFIDSKTLLEINRLLETINYESFVNENDIRSNSSIIKILSDKFLKNSDIYYNFPKEVFNQYNFLKNPELFLNIYYTKILSKIKIYSETLSKTKISIEKFEIYNTLANGDENKINSHWHKDGDLLDSFKILIYLNNVDEDNGALKILRHDQKKIDLNGQAGTAIFFKAAKLSHSGSVPKKTNRWCLNFKIYPSLIISSSIKNKPFNYLRRYNLFL